MLQWLEENLKDVVQKNNSSYFCNMERTVQRLNGAREFLISSVAFPLRRWTLQNKTSLDVGSDLGTYQCLLLQLHIVEGINALTFNIGRSNSVPSDSDKIIIVEKLFSSGHCWLLFYLRACWNYELILIPYACSLTFLNGEYLRLRSPLLRKSWKKNFRPLPIPVRGKVIAGPRRGEGLLPS